MVRRAPDVRVGVSLLFAVPYSAAEVSEEDMMCANDLENNVASFVEGEVDGRVRNGKGRVTTGFLCKNVVA